MLRSQRPQRISKRAGYVESKLSRASIRTALRKSKTSVDVTSESVAKQVNYHWRSLRSASSSTISSPQEKILSKLPFFKLSESDSSVHQKSRRHNSTAENISDFKRRNSGIGAGVNILEQAETYHKPRDSIKKVVLTRWTSRGLICVCFFC